MRVPSVAGSFYPDDAEELESMITKFLGNVSIPKLNGNLRALIVPHAGYIYSGQTAAYGYKLLSQYNNIEKIILLGPSHHALFPGIAESGFEVWKTPLGFVNICSLNLGKLLITSPQVHEPEHCLEVQVPFLQVVMKNSFTLYPMLTGDIDPVLLADVLMPNLDEKTLLLISSDLSHYHSYEKALDIDAIANQAIPGLNFEKLKNAEACGIKAVQTAMSIADKAEWKGKLLHYTTSADASNDKSSVVGYGSYAFYK